MYMPTVARFTARDPLPTNGDPVLIKTLHPYAYANNNPSKTTDPSGLDAAEDFEDAIEDLQDTLNNLGVGIALRRCQAWVALQKLRQGWLKNLPACPCFQCEVDSGDNAGKWTTPKEADQRFHPGADDCVRSVPVVLPPFASGQQCCYKNHELITDGPGAGTPDHVGPGPGDAYAGIHFIEDVRMFFYCEAAGRVDLYLSVRPPNNANKCDAQKV